MKAEDFIDMATDNNEAVEESDSCGCFACGGLYPSEDVEEFDGETAVCPVCGKKAVLPSSNGIPVGEEGYLDKVKQENF